MKHGFKKCLKMFLALVMVFALIDLQVPSVEAVEEQRLTLEENIKINSEGNYVITMAEGMHSTDKTIKIDVGVGKVANVTIQDLNINSSDTNIFNIVSGEVHLKIQGENTFYNGSEPKNANVRVAEGTTLVVEEQSTGSLVVNSFNGAAIGGNWIENNNVRHIIINGGTITATSRYGAAIGSGREGGSSYIEINGGTITAKSNLGAAIGSGYGAGVSEIKITGGIVNAKIIQGYNNGAAIGSGFTSEKAMITISGGIITANAVGQGSGIGNGASVTGSEITINGNAVIYANTINGTTNSHDWSGVVFMGDSGQVYKDVEVKQDFEVPFGKTLTIPTNTTLTIPEGITLKNSGTVNNEGTIKKYGTIVGSISGNTILVPTLTISTNGIDTNKGKVVSDYSKAFEGDIVTLTILPEDGYVLKPNSVNVTNATDLKQSNTTQYTFTMPNTDVLVNAEFIKPIQITSQSPDTQVYTGQSVELEVEIAQDWIEEEVKYQWYEVIGNTESEIKEATSQSYSTPSTLSVGEHIYYCIATQGEYSSQSNQIKVEVLKFDTEFENGIQLNSKDNTFTYGDKIVVNVKPTKEVDTFSLDANRMAIYRNGVLISNISEMNEEGIYTMTVDTIDLGVGENVILTAQYAGSDILNSYSQDFEVKISTKTLTITAEDKTIQVNEQLPMFTYSTTELVEGHTYSELTLATTASSSDLAGTYPIVVSGGKVMNGNVEVTENYDIKYINGTLTIAEQTYEVILNASVGGIVDGAGTYEVGTEVTVRAIANEGYEFEKWMNGEEVVSTNSEYTFIVDKNCTLDAMFEKKKPTPILDPEPTYPSKPDYKEETVKNEDVTISGEFDGKVEIKEPSKGSDSYKETIDKISEKDTVIDEIEIKVPDHKGDIDIEIKVDDKYNDKEVAVIYGNGKETVETNGKVVDGKLTFTIGEMKGNITVLVVEKYTVLDLSPYADGLLPVYPNSRVTSISLTENGFKLSGYAFVKDKPMDYINQHKLVRELIFVNEENTSIEYAYRQSVKATPKGSFLTSNVLLNPTGKVDYTYATYEAEIKYPEIMNYKKNMSALASGKYRIYVRVSDGKHAYLMPLVDRVLSDGSTLTLPSNMELVDSESRELRLNLQ